MPDPKDPTPVRVEKRGGMFVVVDSAGKQLAGQEALDDSAKAKAVAARVNSTWAKAKSERRGKGGPEITEAWSPASRVAAALARKEHGGGDGFSAAKAGVSLKEGDHFLHHPYGDSPTHYVAKSVTPGRNNEVHVHAVAADGSHEKNIRFTRAAEHPDQVSWQRKNMVHVRESVDLREDWSPQARAAALAARKARGSHGPAAGLATQRAIRPYAATPDENEDLHGINPMHYDPEHGSKKSSQTHIANIARHVGQGHGRVTLPSGVTVRKGMKQYVVRSKSGQEMVMHHDSDVEGRTRAAALALRTHRNGGEFPKGLKGLKHGSGAIGHHHLFHALLDDLADAARADQLEP